MENSLLFVRKRAKSEKMHHISACVLSLDITKGNLNWKVTELVRKAKVSRGIVYRYFGGTKEQILENSVKTFVENLTTVIKKADSEPFPKVLKELKNTFEQYPETAMFYHRWRGKEGLIQREFINLELQIQKKIREQIPSLSEEEILAALVWVYGIATAPFITSAEVEVISNELLKKKDLKVLTSPLA